MTEGNRVHVDFDPFAHGEIARTAPLTPPQRELWSAIQLGGADANRAYNEAVAVRLRGELDESALARALSTLAERHDALRATIAADGSALLIGATAELTPERVDLRTESDPEQAFRALCEQRVSLPLSLTDGPLGRTLLARLAGDDFRLLLVFHHIVCDGWSLGVLLEELAALYSAEHQREPAKLPPVESFAAFAEEQREAAQRSESKAALSFWLDQFAESVPVLELPTVRPRPALRTYRAARIDHTLDPSLVSALRELARQHGASMHQLLLTGFQTLVARISGQWDLVVGLPTAGQAYSGHLRLVGHLVSYLPLRATLDPHASVLDALARTKQRMGDALEHQGVTFGTLLENLPIPRDPSRVPLAPVCFNLEQAAAEGGFDGLESSVTTVPRTFEAFELFANLVDRKQTIVIELQYNRDLFDAALVREWVESFEVLLRGMVAAPHAELARLPVLTQAARAALESLSANALPFEPEVPIQGFVERAADAHAGGDALVFEDERLSYAELEARANRLAHHLRARGVVPDAIVGVCIRRSIDTLVAQLAVLKAGGAYLPLDPSYPRERLAYMLEDAGAKLVVTRTDTASVLSIERARCVVVDEEADALAALPTTRPSPVNIGRHLAYVIYTSGSTGKPKGVLVEHRNFASFLAAMRARLPLAPPGVFLCATSTGFDISLLEIFGALASGFCVVVHSDESDATYDIPALVERHGVTHFQCTPSQATIQVATERGRAALGKLSTLILGGEALAADLARNLLDLLAGGRLFNGYGPTETTIYSTMYEVKQVDGPIPIGTPVANTRAYVLDPEGQPCMRGSVGELYLGGAGVTRGYHRLPELTAERFLRDPLAHEAHARMYRTGDLVRLRSDGALEYLGRNDHQVKIRGFRIELGEIEVALRAHPAVREAVVTAREDRPGDKRLVAYLVCDGAPTIPELKAHLTARGLPEYMLPQAFVTLPKLPTTGSGKLDRRALPPPEAESSLGIGEHVAPRTDTERRLAAIWEEVLGVRGVSVRDGFFDLGGHSVLAVRLASRIGQELGIEVPVARLFQAVDIERLAAFVDASLLSAPASETGGELVEIEL